MKNKKVLWYVFHESLGTSRGNNALVKMARTLPSATVVDAYSEYGNFSIDAGREQSRLSAHDLIVFQHPFYWYSVPALFKQWLDKVLTYGFAYPPKEGRALHGKAWLSVITTGGPDWSYRSGGYNNFTMSELLRPLQQTAYLCGMNWLAPHIIHGVLPGDYEAIKATTDAQLSAHCEKLRDFVECLDLSERHSLEPVAAPHFLKSNAAS